jgi:hypothetical protein
MNKAMNTAVFMVVATAFSLAMMVVVILISIVLVGWLTQMGLAQGVASVLLVVFTLGGLAGSFFAYGRVIKLVDRKIDLSSKIYPLFQRRRK